MKWNEIESIFERKCQFSLERNKPKGIWESNNTLLNEEIFVSSIIHKKIDDLSMNLMR